MNWREVTPKLCNQTLVAYEKNNNQGFIKKLDIADGHVIATIPVQAVKQDLCDE